jgi:hypothetical protein
LVLETRPGGCGGLAAFCPDCSPRDWSSRWWHQASEPGGGNPDMTDEGKPNAELEH